MSAYNASQMRGGGVSLFNFSYIISKQCAVTRFFRAIHLSTYLYLALITSVLICQFD